MRRRERRKFSVPCLSLPCLPSVDQNIQQAGREAVRLLLSLIERPREITTSIEVEPLLIERESTRA